MPSIEKLIFTGLLALALSAQADEAEWNTSWDGTLYVYGNSMVLRDDSVLNPYNQIARLPQRSEVAEIRMNLKAENETVRVTARPIGIVRESRNAFGTQRDNEGYLSLWQVRVRAAEGWNVAAGRDVLNWGAGQFRSPSSPFYFDNGRSDPMRELVGMDVAKVSWTPDMRNSATLARVVRSGYGAVQPDAWRNSWLAKFDTRGEEIAWGAVVAKAPHLGAFYGAHGQYTMSDELMLYGEWSSSVLPVVLGSPADAAQPYVIQSPSARRNAALAGSSYTFESGQSLMLEYLHDGHGYSRAEEAAYFERATTQYGLPLGLMPRLLGRDYFHAVWQANMMSETGYWRLMYTRNLTDSGNEFAAYGETTLHPRLSIFALAVLPRGGARQEAGALFTRSFTLGLKSSI
ncbi:MAG: hypothetical protein KJ795_13200 [Gammaproteobacteria bacterium]|nr:hypothetical protein [Gammaproteobacteria bacterium]MBU1777669.1 hypothetical protein [Gammaproteobacteria bacterium]MBU1968334.1 hypothetical protein [Gammaproteobacteria bacterium]